MYLSGVLSSFQTSKAFNIFYAYWQSDIAEKYWSRVVTHAYFSFEFIAAGCRIL